MTKPHTQEHNTEPRRKRRRRRRRRRGGGGAGRRVSRHATETCPLKRSGEEKKQETHYTTPHLTPHHREMVFPLEGNTVAEHTDIL